MQDILKKQISFIKSALTQENSFNSTAEIIEWIKERNKVVSVVVNRTNFSSMKNWKFDVTNGNLRHDTGQFFSIDGLHIETNFGEINSWKQPIINQPEIGYLGFLTKEFNDVLYFLVQAKIEPGNVNNVQLSPTLQATKSNYTQVHKGKKPMYLEYFVERGRCEVLLDQLQSEQGARFLKKRNRNIIIKTNEDIKLNENFVWMTLGQIKFLIGIDNLVNMDTRTVISGISLGFEAGFIHHKKLIENVTLLTEFSREIISSTLENENPVYSLDEIIAWYTDLKCKYELKVNLIPLNRVNKWIISDDEIFHEDRKYFRIIAANIEINNREVTNWMQPLVEPSQEGLIAFIIKKFNGCYHFLVQAKVECGNFDTVELAPTVQCLTGNYKESSSDKLPYLKYVLNASRDQIRVDVIQSEEGGRFFREQNRNLIIEADDNFPFDLHSNYIWISYLQLHQFLRFNNFLNIQARSLISSLSIV